MGRKAKLSEAKRSAAAAYFIESRQALQSGSVIVDATSSTSKCLLTEAESSSTAATFTPLSPALTMAELASSTGMIFDAGSSALSLANTSNAGRFYVAAKPIAAGDLILDTAVHAAVVCEGLVSHVCAFCMKRSDSPLQLCSSCGYVAFCSNKCKDMCAEIHDLECASLANLRQRTSGLSPEALTWLRLVLQDAVQGASSPAKFLCSSVGTVSKTKRKAWQRIATALRNFCGDALPSDWSTQRAFEILSACENNCFGIWQDGKKLELARSLCVPASFFNHSCFPNVARVSSGRSFKFYAIRNVPQGEALGFSYIDPTMHKSERRLHLSTWGFKCECPRCEGPEDLFSAMLCTTHLGYLIPDGFGGFFCSTCCSP